MKRIGYIYKYNPSEGMGILMFGVWKVKGYWGTTKKNTPILFSDNDLLSDVSAGQLVYFDYNGKTASNIERASLSNFNVEYINSIIRCKNGESEHSFYTDNTVISFERLDNIIIPNEDEKEEGEYLINKEDDCDDEDDVEDDRYDSIDWCFCEPDGVTDSLSITGFNSNIIDEGSNHFFKSIKELFNYFGKYKHKDTKDSLSLNIFDLSFWVDTEVLNTEYYGKKVDELLFLYDIFVLKKRYDTNGNIIRTKNINDCISSNWTLLLSKFSEDNLKDIICRAPKLQPALPVDFCKKNIDLLTDDYEMPNVEICKLFCIHIITNAKTVSEYKDIKNKLFIYRNCTKTHFEGEGMPMCKMGKTLIGNLEKQLEDQYKKVIKQNVKAQLLQLCDNYEVMQDFINNHTPEDFEKVALFIENYDNLKSDFLGYEVCNKVLESYEKLPKPLKDAFVDSLINCVNESAICATQSDNLTPFILRYHVELFGNWIRESTKQQIKELVNERFSRLDNLEDLREAYKANYITEQQYSSKYEQITSDFSIFQFLEELSMSRIDDSPTDIQWYVVSNIINQLGYKSLDSFKFVKLRYEDSISDIRSLLKWLSFYGHLNKHVLKKAQEKICSVLSKDEMWTLFEEKIILSPGIENIRERLDRIYKSKFGDKTFYDYFQSNSDDNELLKLNCFQDVLLSDMESVKNPDIELFIADKLDSKHRYLMLQKATGFMRLYLWQKKPSINYDWDLIRSHYHELPANAQIKTLRYIFGKMSSGVFSLSFDDLYSSFVKTTAPACSAICGILYILKTKMNDLNASITQSMIESVIGEGKKRQIDFLKYSEELFYPCHGYLAISGIKFDIEYQSFNGILTKENKNDELYYVIEFYDSPVDLFGRTIEWLDSEEVVIAEQVLLRNSSVDVINGKYYIHSSNEFFVKQFVIAYDIDDKCGLVSDKERLIDSGFLPRNNAYQPLYTNEIRKYEDSNYYICRGGCFGSSDPNNNIPFFWCKQRMCVRRAHFLLPPSKWEDYRFADLLYILLGQSSNVRESVWRVNSEISQFLCNYSQVYESNESNICSKPLEESEERGIWGKDSSIYRDIYDFDDDEYDDMF